MKIYGSDDLFIALSQIIDLPESVISLTLHLSVHEIPTVIMLCEAQENKPQLKIVRGDRKEFKFKLERIYDEDDRTD